MSATDQKPQPKRPSSFWTYANPVKFLAFSERVLPTLWVLAAVSLLVGLVWGFFFTPDDFRQGSTVKIIYLHVPAALMAINAWLMMLVASLIWIVRRHHVSALAARAAAPVGAVMTLIALVTGAASGIGKACVEALLEQGAAVAALASRPALAEPAGASPVGPISSMAVGRYQGKEASVGKPVPEVLVEILDEPVRYPSRFGRRTRFQRH